MGKDVIIACDFPSAEAVLSFLSSFRDRKPYVKVGMELFYSEGPPVVREIKKRGHKVFLDLKLHDIPNTVEKAMAALSKLDADMYSVHAAGTIAMMEAAARGLARAGGTRPLLVAVTQLTSTNQERMENELLIREDLGRVVLKYAGNAKKAGLNGIVCSPLEAEKIHQAFGKDFYTVTPGIRFSGAARDDQARTATPAGAKLAGSDFIVVGRPVTRAEDPVAAYEKICMDFISSTE